MGDLPFLGQTQFVVSANRAGRESFLTVSEAATGEKPMLWNGDGVVHWHCFSRDSETRDVILKKKTPRTESRLQMTNEW